MVWRAAITMPVAFCLLYAFMGGNSGMDAFRPGEL